MAFKIIWSEQALEDLRIVVAFIARGNPAAAESFGYQIISKVDVLAQYPQFGRRVPEEDDETIREIIFRPYRIIYKVLESLMSFHISRFIGGGGILICSVISPSRGRGG